MDTNMDRVAQSEIDLLTQVLLKSPREAFVDDRTIASQWGALNFTAPPVLSRAMEEFDGLVEIIRSCGADVRLLPPDERTTLDSIYARDASIVCDRGLILCRMGKAARGTEPEAQERAIGQMDGLRIPIVGRIEPPGLLEGGDVFWLDARTIVVGRGYRTNDQGIRQLRALLSDSIDELIVVPLPHWHGRGDVMHLMSLVSPVDRDLAAVYSPLLPVPFRECLLDRGLTLVEVPDDEFATMGTNVLALSPRRCVMLAGNPRTRAALERAGADVAEYKGDEISVKGAGGPTCLTRPLSRRPPPHVTG
jgi:N-dimethylarginine dimethylaminohydrolase